VLLLSSVAYAWVADTIIFHSPVDDSSARGDVDINITFSDFANITVEYNLTGSWYPLNASNDTDSSFNFTWPTMNGSFSDGHYDIRAFVMNSTNASDNTTWYVYNITIDNTPPNVTNVTYSNSHPHNGTQAINITLNVSDYIGVSVVWLSNGTDNISLVQLSGNAYVGRYSRQLNLSNLGCQDEAVCGLRIFTNDTLNNTKDSITTDVTTPILIIDTDPPRLVQNSTNVSSALVNEPVRFSSLWNDIALLQNPGLSTVLELYNHTSHQFVAYTSQYVTASGTSNYSNVSYVVQDAYEGQTLIGRISANDTNNHQNYTSNLSIVIGNYSPNVTITAPVNTSFVNTSQPIMFTMRDFGAGISLSSIAVLINASGTTIPLSYANNQTYFNCSCTDGCGSTYSASVHTRTCKMSKTWLAGEHILSINVSDIPGNTNGTSIAFTVVDEFPDIVNISVNGTMVAASSVGASVWGNVTSESGSLLINWSVKTAPLRLNTTSILPAVISGVVQSYNSLPASYVFNAIAGKNYFTINATINDSSITETVQLNLTVNTPLNLSALRSLYLDGGHGLLTEWNVTNGTHTLLSDAPQYVNKTLELIATAEVQYNPSYAATLRYSGFNGLDLRWNATPNAFNISNGSTAEMVSLSTTTRSNVIALLRNDGEQELFFDNRSYLVGITFNLSVVNITPYYVQKNMTHETMYLLRACNGTPTTPVNVSTMCFVNTSDTATLYLPRFEQRDRVFLANVSVSAPGLELRMASRINQSVIPLRFEVVTPSPNTTFCAMNLTSYNASNVTLNNLSFTIPLSNFSVTNYTWVYQANITGVADGRYNISVECADIRGMSNSTRLNFNVSDTTRPGIYDVNVSDIGIGGADISGYATEIVTFRVRYGTEQTALTNDVLGEEPGLFDTITLEDLEPDTTYYYNLTACDLKNYCNTSATYYFRTLDIGEDRSGSGGGGGAPPAALASGIVEKSSSRVWSVVDRNTLLEFVPTNNLTVTKLAVHFTEPATAVKLGVRQFKSKPEILPDTPGVAYKFFSIDHLNVEFYADDFLVTFNVPSSWFAQQQVDPSDLLLYRFEGKDWVPYTPHSSVIEGTAHKYTVDVPGFSYFAIAAKNGVMGVTAMNTTTPPPALSGTNDSVVVQYPVETDVAPVAPIVPSEEQPIGEFITNERTARKSLPMFVWVIGIVIVGLMGTLVGMQQYKKHQQRDAVHREQLKSEYRHMQLTKSFHRDGGAQVQGVAAPNSTIIPIEHRETHHTEHDPAKPMIDYIVRMRAKNTPDDEIRKRLISVGWDALAIDMELLSGKK